MPQVSVLTKIIKTNNNNNNKVYKYIFLNKKININNLIIKIFS